MSLIPLALSNLLAKTVAPRLLGKFGYRNIMVVNTFTIGTLLAAFYFISPGTHELTLLGMLALLGAANSIQFTCMNTLTLIDLPNADASSGNSLLSTIMQLSIAVSIAAASLLLDSFSPLSAFLMALMIQARHLFYGLTMLQRYRGYGLRSVYMIFAMSDETFSITCSAEPPEGVDKGWFMFFITLLDQIYWVASAAMGAALGSVLPFSTEGVDFVMTAMFVVIFLNQWEKEKQHASAVIGLAAPLVCLRIFGAGSFLIPSMVCILAALLLLRRPIEAKESEAAR